MLFHYLHMAPERARQVAKYEQLLGLGATALAAAEGAFGDLDKLEREMESYQRRSKVTSGCSIVQKGALPREAWKDVRSQFVKANKVANDHPIPLVHFYLAYLERGQRPIPNAISGVEWAMRFAPASGRAHGKGARVVEGCRVQDCRRTADGAGLRERQLNARPWQVS